MKSKSLGNDRSSSFFKATPSFDSNVQLMLRAEVPREDICVLSCSSHVLTRVILWQELGCISLPSFLANGSVSLAETVRGQKHTCLSGTQPGFASQACITRGHVGEFRPVDVSRSDTHHFLVSWSSYNKGPRTGG